MSVALIGMGFAKLNRISASPFGPRRPPGSVEIATLSDTTSSSQKLRASNPVKLGPPGSPERSGAYLLLRKNLTTATTNPLDRVSFGVEFLSFNLTARK